MAGLAITGGRTGVRAGDIAAANGVIIISCVLKFAGPIAAWVDGRDGGGGCASIGASVLGMPRWWLWDA
jgi:hypothetical protein